MTSRDLLISFSGGETSAYMTMLILDNWSDLYDNIAVVFANTSKEKEETLEFIKRCDEYYGFNTIWIEPTFDGKKRDGYRVVNYDTAKRSGEVFEEMIKAYGMPNFAYPHCTRELKSYPIRAFAKDHFGHSRYYTAIGIRADEFDRVSADHNKLRYKYPLVSEGVTKKHINTYFKNAPFRLSIKSYEGNCDLCWKKTTRKLMTIIKDHPDSAKWWINIESRYGGYIPQHRKRTSLVEPKTFKRNESIQDIVELSKLSFHPSRDDRFDYGIQNTLFDEYLDKGYGCEESCEPF